MLAALIFVGGMCMLFVLYGVFCAVQYIPYKRRMEKRGFKPVSFCKWWNRQNF